MPDVRQRIENDFKFHPALTETVAAVHGKARDACLEAACKLVDIVPEGRELSLALTKLEEAMFWANAGIARN